MLARNIHDEDTIEMQLSAAQLEALTQAAAKCAEEPETAERGQAAPAHSLSVWPAGTAAPAPTLQPPPSVAERRPAIVPSVSAKHAPAHAPRRPILAVGLRVAAAAAVAVAIVVALLAWPTHRAPEPAATPTAPATITVPAHESTPQPAPGGSATELASSDPPPVRFANPFDSGEVFEFPAGTSHVEARDQVAQVLLARARERNTVTPPTRKTTATARPDRTRNEASLARQL